MKKVLSLISILMVGGALMAQTFVSTSVEKRNAILEEYTGVNCGYCPDGHRIANELAAQYNGSFFAINVHQGGYAARYTTQWGNALANQTGLDGYPSGTINRHAFSMGGSTALSRGDWAEAASLIMSEDSPVNVAAVLTADNDSRELSIHIQVFYTNNSAQATNKLNVALLQNNVIGPQQGASYNPDYQEGSQYRHMHMLRNLLTGQWGVDIPATQSTFIDTTITYTVPASIEGVSIPTLDDLEVVVFIAEGHQEIITGTKAIRPVTVPEILSMNVENEECSLEYVPVLEVANYTWDTVSSIVVDYNGSNVTLDGPITPMGTKTFEMENYNVPLTNGSIINGWAERTAVMRNFTMTSGRADTVTDGSTFTVSFADFDIFTVSGTLTAKLWLDQFGRETTLQLVDTRNCQPVWTEGPYNNTSETMPQYVNELVDGRLVTITFEPQTAGLYILRLNDEYGDGMWYTSEAVPSGLELLMGSSSLFHEYLGYPNMEAFSHKDFWLNVISNGSGAHSASSDDPNVGIDDATVVDFSVYPNPVSNVLSIRSEQAVRLVEVMDVTGRSVATFAGQNTIDVSNMVAGMYIIRVTTENGMGVQKFVKE